jgi:hypothetical protein
LAESELYAICATKTSRVENQLPANREQALNSASLPKLFLDSFDQFFSLPVDRVLGVEQFAAFPGSLRRQRLDRLLGFELVLKAGGQRR